MTPDQFSQFLCDPTTAPMLDAMIAENRRIDAQLAGVPESKPCPFCDRLALFVRQQGSFSIYRCEVGHTTLSAMVR